MDIEQVIEKIKGEPLTSEVSDTEKLFYQLHQQLRHQGDLERANYYYGIYLQNNEDKIRRRFS
ncbi:MAG: hypothetical protein AABX91_02435 [Nanoarchaeota archaeon]